MALKIILTVIAILLLVFVCVAVIDSNRFVVRKYDITADTDKDYYFVFLSDLHNRSFGNKNEKLIKKINSLESDAVILGGDMLTAHPGCSFETAVSLVESLAENHRIIYAYGNHEYRTMLYPQKYGSMYEDYVKAIASKGVRLLFNEYEDVGNIRFYGLEIPREYYTRFKLIPMSENVIKESVGVPSDEKVNVLLAHNPEYMPAYTDWGADITLSGHMHGGLVRIPGIGGVVSPRCTLFPHYDGGRFKQGANTMIVSRGLGLHTIPIRVFNPGEIVYIHIKKR